MSDELKLDPVIEESIREAVQKFGQSEKLANRIIVWFSSGSSRDIGNEENEAFLENVLEMIKVDKGKNDEV